MKKIISITFSLFFFACEVVNIDYLEPIMITGEPTSILTNSAIFSGRVLGEGGKDVIEYGIVWSESFPPTIQDNKSIEGQRIGIFSERYQGLKSNTTYYCSAYGINEVGVGYGVVYEFTTNSEPPCNPPIDNRIDLGEEILNIENIIFKNESLGFNDGNVQFQTRTSNSTAYITMQFNEINGDLPLTGEYITVNTFDNQSIKSNREVKLKITDFGIGSLGGGKADPNEKVYIQNDGTDNITFIFCNVVINENYTLNGKCSFTP